MSTAIDSLTKRQAQIYGIIRRHVRTGVPPTVREIQGEMGIGSPNGVMCHLKVLERKGLITRDVNLSRGIRLVDESPAMPPAPNWMVVDAVRWALASPAPEAAARAADWLAEHWQGLTGSMRSDVRHHVESLLAEDDEFRRRPADAIFTIPGESRKAWDRVRALWEGQHG